jgi:hypothetical protein
MYLRNYVSIFFRDYILIERGVYELGTKGRRMEKKILIKVENS